MLKNWKYKVSDIARQHSQNIFMPLIEQLVQRAVYIIGRLPNIALSIMMAQKKTEDGKESSIAASLDDFPYFWAELLNTTLYLLNLVQTTLSKCRDEFYSTKTLCWDLTEFAILFISTTNKFNYRNTSIVNNEGKHADWANELFKRIKERITATLWLRFTTSSFVPMYFF